MSRYFIYDSANGRVLMEGIGPLSSVDPQEFGVNCAVLAYEGDLPFDRAYVDSGSVLPRQTFALSVSATQITADGLDTAVISGVPEGTTIQWPDGQMDVITDGVVEFAVDLPGTYTLRFSAIPYLDQEVAIEAVAAA